MATTHPRTIHDRAHGIRRQIDALARDPSEWDPGDLDLLSGLEGVIAAARSRVIHGLREQGATDRQIGEALGITQQAVSKRWPGGGRYVGAAGRYRSATRVTHDDS